MERVTGRVIFVQEGRFRLMSDGGQAQLFLLSPQASLEPQDLPALMQKEGRCTVRFTRRKGLIAGIAHDIRAVPDMQDKAEVAAS